VLTHIQEALHPEFVSLLHHETDEKEFRSIACAPASHTPPRLEADGKLVALLRVVGKPLQLAALAVEWLVEEQRVELLVPIAVGSDGPESLLALGPKRSEEP